MRPWVTSSTLRAVDSQIQSSVCGRIAHAYLAFAADGPPLAPAVRDRLDVEHDDYPRDGARETPSPR